jgi:hypothetical protein
MKIVKEDIKQQNLTDYCKKIFYCHNFAAAKKQRQAFYFLTVRIIFFHEH